MAGKLEPREVKSQEVVEDGEGQTESSEKTKDLLEMVKKLQKEGSLEPQIEDLINRIHELQQAKEKSSEELGEVQALWEALRQDLDSLSGEKVHLEEVLSRKQEALRTLQLHCQRKAEEAQRNYVLAEHTEQISIQNSQVTESQGQSKLGLPMEEQLEDLIGPHKDLWEFHMLKRRLAWEIRALQSSQEQLLTEERQALARLEDVERRLLLPPEAPAARAVIGGLKAEPEKLGGEAPAQTQSTPEDRAGAEEAASSRFPDPEQKKKCSDGLEAQEAKAADPGPSGLAQHFQGQQENSREIQDYSKWMTAVQESIHPWSLLEEEGTAA
ncbi:synaptonemal complex central element protein 1-like isoform X3 [Odocoileus virginianus]|uniref:Synaptonemal complex central element protein 1-like isoform X3 n=1 Tax=Odocoileus virginianus TaxID=9874 RepID=A0ABM4GWD6_ODOVR